MRGAVICGRSVTRVETTTYIPAPACWDWDRQNWIKLNVQHPRVVTRPVTAATSCRVRTGHRCSARQSFPNVSQLSRGCVPRVVWHVTCYTWLRDPCDCGPAEVLWTRAPVTRVTPPLTSGPRRLQPQINKLSYHTNYLLQLAIYFLIQSSV